MRVFRLQPIRTVRCFSSANDEVPFGFQNVPKGEKQGKVNEVFAKVADTYDKMNDAMSLGIHRAWKDQFVKILGPVPGVRVLDLAGGTGDISFRIIEALKDQKKRGSTAVSEVILTDINPNMLSVGEDRARKLGYLSASDPQLSIRVINAQEIDLPDNSVDAVTMAFGIRNCPDVPQVLREAHRVLKHGGRFLCLEFSEVRVPGLRELYDVYSFNVIPKLGEVIAGDKDSYQYLVESIRRFPSQDVFAEMFKEAGFEEVEYTNFMGGISCIHSGFKFDQIKKD